MTAGYDRPPAGLPVPDDDSAADHLVKRVTLVIRDGQIEHVFYPIFPTDTHAAQVLAWAAEHPIGAS